MQEVPWEDGSYQNGTSSKHGSTTRSSNGGQAKNTAYDVVSGKSNGEVASYLFQRQGVASSFPKTVGEKEEGFGGRQWSSGERMADQVSLHIFSNQTKVCFRNNTNIIQNQFSFIRELVLYFCELTNNLNSLFKAAKCGFYSESFGCRRNTIRPKELGSALQNASIS